jgi:hypothetical protein
MINIAARRRQLLLPFHREEQAQVVEYRAVAGTCNACPVKAACTESERGRHIHRSFFADYLERVKGYRQTFARPAKPCASAKCGSNHSLPKGSNGMG